MPHVVPTYTTNDFINPKAITNNAKRFCVKLSDNDNLDSIKLLANCLNNATCIAVEPNFPLRLEDVEEDFDKVRQFILFCCEIGRHSNYRIIVPFTTNLLESDRTLITKIAEDMPKYPNIRVCIKNGQYIPNNPKEIIREPRRIPTITKLYNMHAEHYATVGLDTGFAEQTIRNANLILNENSSKSSQLKIADYIAAYKDECRTIFVSHIKHYEYKKSDFNEDNGNILRDEWLFPIHSFFNKRTKYIADINVSNIENSAIFTRETKLLKQEIETPEE